MMKCLELCTKLYLAIRKEKWKEANELADELKAILETYKWAC